MSSSNTHKKLFVLTHFTSCLSPVFSFPFLWLAPWSLKLHCCCFCTLFYSPQHYYPRDLGRWGQQPFLPQQNAVLSPWQGNEDRADFLVFFFFFFTRIQLTFNLKEKGDHLFSTVKGIFYLQSLELATWTDISLWNRSFFSDLFPDFFLFKN